jgi:hypothetical protein
MKLNMDEIALYTTEELLGRLNNLYDYRRKAEKSGANSFNDECNICYIQRELQIRNARAAAHQLYIGK